MSVAGHIQHARAPEPRTVVPCPTQVNMES